MTTLDERYSRFNAEIERARSGSREAVYRATVLSATIVAFSATVLSIERLRINVNETLLGVSWSLFAAVVVVGPLSLALEARAQFLVTWRNLQPQDFDSPDRKPTPKERVKLLSVLAYSLAIRPRNLIYARISDYDEEKPTQDMWMNFRMVLLAHKVWDVALGLEAFVWVFFSSAVIVLVVALFP
jgi:hypothetical protein